MRDGNGGDRRRTRVKRVPNLLRDWHVGALLLYSIAALLMSYPLAFRPGAEWVPRIRGTDVFMKLWDVWWFPAVLKGNDSPFHTGYMFYPEGLDQTFHSISWTAAALGGLLTPVTGSVVSAYKWTILIGLVASGFSCYLLIFYLLRDRVSAWTGGAIYAFAPYVIAHSSGHTDLSQTAPIPLTVLLIIVGVRQRRKAVAVAAGVMAGVTALTSLYLLNFLMLTLLLLFVGLALQEQRYRQGWFIRLCLLFGVVAVGTSLLRVGPILANLEQLSASIEAKYGAPEEYADLLAFVIPSVKNPLFTDLVSSTTETFRKSKGYPPYLGIVPLLLTGIALSWRRRAGEIWPWFGMAGVFFLLSLGPILHIQGEVFPAVPMLFRLDRWLPPLRVTAPNYFHVALLLPLAIVAAYGILRLRRWLQRFDRRVSQLVLLLIPLLLVEYWNGPYPMSETPVPPFYAELADNYEGEAIISLPMGRHHSKFWLYYQTVHGVPVVEGLSGRTPDSAYDYIRDNALLSAWAASRPLDCTTADGTVLDEAVARLVDDGFYYVIIQKFMGAEWANSYFADPPIYESYVLIVHDLRLMEQKSFCGGS